MKDDPMNLRNELDDKIYSGRNTLDLIFRRQDVLKAASEYEMATAKYCIAIASYILKHPGATDDDRREAAAGGTDLPKLLVIQARLPSLREGIKKFN